MQYAFRVADLPVLLILKIKKGDFITIVGKSGCGKSTLFKIITGLIETNNVKVYDSIYEERGVLVV